jgi:hypothetical protein
MLFIGGILCQFPFSYKDGCAKIWLQISGNKSLHPEYQPKVLWKVRRKGKSLKQQLASNNG